MSIGKLGPQTANLTLCWCTRVACAYDVCDPWLSIFIKTHACANKRHY